jgi:hypothetical protein
VSPRQWVDDIPLRRPSHPVRLWIRLRLCLIRLDVRLHRARRTLRSLPVLWRTSGDGWRRVLAIMAALAAAVAATCVQQAQLQVQLSDRGDREPLPGDAVLPGPAGTPVNLVLASRNRHRPAGVDDLWTDATAAAARPVPRHTAPTARPAGRHRAGQAAAAVRADLRPLLPVRADLRLSLPVTGDVPLDVVGLAPGPGARSVAAAPVLAVSVVAVRPAPNPDEQESGGLVSWP